MTVAPEVSTKRPVSIHTSERVTFKRCRELWNFSSPNRLNLEPIPKGVGALWFGTGIHAALALYYSPSPVERSPVERLDCARLAWRHYCENAEFTVDEETFQLGDLMLQYYGSWAPSNDDFEVVAVEEESHVSIEVPKFGPTDYSFRLDGLVRQRDTGKLYIKEFKTAAKFDSTYDYLLLDDQAGSYLAFKQQAIGEPLEGIIYTFLKKKAPSGLQLLKNGHLSMNKIQDTTYDVAKAQIQSHYDGRVPEGYHEFLAYLREKPNNFVQRHVIRRSQTEIKAIARSVPFEMYDMMNDPAIYRNPTAFNCNGCAFFQPCLLKWEGSDYKTMLAVEYRQRENEFNKTKSEVASG